MTGVRASGANLRELTRRAVQAQIASHAVRLFNEQGFDATTVEQIAEAAGISSRSFFRYFPTKEDVVIGDPVEPGRVLQAALEARPSGETPWVALRRAVGALTDLVDAAPVLSVRTAAIMLETPALRARHLEKQFVWEEMLVPDVVRRLGPGRHDGGLRAHALVSSALSCFDAAVNEWASTGGTRPIEELLDTAFDAVRR